MISKLLGITVFILPFAINLAPSNAESWQDWVQKNPTYKAPTPVQTAPSTVKQRPSSTKQSTGTGFSSSQPSSLKTSPPSFQGEGLSTHHPLFEQQFLAGCQQNPQYAKQCQCALKEIQNSYTIQDVMTIAKFMQDNGELPSEIYSIALKCVS